MSHARKKARYILPPFFSNSCSVARGLLPSSHSDVLGSKLLHFDARSQKTLRILRMPYYCLASMSGSFATNVFRQKEFCKIGDFAQLCEINSTWTCSFQQNHQNSPKSDALDEITLLFSCFSVSRTSGKILLVPLVTRKNFSL